MDNNQAKNETLTRFLDRLGEAELALQEYLSSQVNSPDKASTLVPGEDYLTSLRERAEKARFDDSMALDGLSESEIKHLFHELQVHQVELHMQNEELRRVQLELEASRDRFSRLYDFAPIGYCTIDRKGIIQEANYTLCNLLGVRIRELIGKPIQHYIDPEDQDRFFLYHRAAIQNSSNQICELQMIGSSGARFTAQFESRSVPDQPDQFWLVVSDISNLRRGEEVAARYEAVLAASNALEIERSRYRDLFELDPDSYIVTDETGMILIANLAATALFNTTKEQLVGTSIAQYVFPEYQPVFYDFFKRMMKMTTEESGILTEECELQTQSYEGDPKSVIASAVLLRDRPGESVRIRWLFRDVTLHKQTEVALGKSQSRFHALFEESFIGIRLFDDQGICLASNRALANILGYNENELSQTSLYEMTDPLDRARDESLFKSLLSGEIDRYTIEKRVMRKDRSTVWVHQVVFWVRDEPNHAHFIVAMTENISERKQMENDLTEIRQRLIDAPEVERLYLSQELHDGPMQVLYGVSYKLKSLWQVGNHTPEDDRILSECTDTITQVIGELRGYASELRPPTLMTFGLEKAIRSHVEQFRTEHPEINIRLYLEPDKQRLPERVRLALFRIYQQAMANIIRHAQASKVNIWFNLDEHSVRLSVEDNGRGFDVPERLVGLVRKGHLGLVGAAERAEAIGGELTIASRPGKGTKILVEVNLAKTTLHE